MTPEQPLVTSRTKRLLTSRYGLWLLGAISFVESSLVVPIITDPFLVVYVLANQTRLVVAVIVTTITSVAGGVAAYIFALLLQTALLEYLSPESVAEFTMLAERFRSETFALTILGAVTPIPYTLVAMAAGFVGGNIWIFILASVLGRGVRYTIVGYVTHVFGPHAMQHIRRNIALASIVTVGLVALYWYLH